MLSPGRRLAPALLCLALGPSPCPSAPPQARVEARRADAQFNPASLDDTFQWALNRARALQATEDDATSLRPPVDVGVDYKYRHYVDDLNAFRGYLRSHVGASVTWMAKVVSIRPDGLHLETRRSGVLPRDGRKPKYLDIEVEFLEPGAKVPESSPRLDTRSGAEIRAQGPSRESVIRLDPQVSKDLARSLKPGSEVTIW